jgi:aryl-alcohol dehydrogenase-like predicted oxidoreductase
VFTDARVLSVLARLREDGLAIGFTTTGPRQAETIRRAMAVTVDGAALFQVVQSTWNVLEPSSGTALAEAHAAGLGVIVKEALANGRLAAQDDVAIAMALRQPWAGVVLSGAVTVDQLHSNLRALNLALTAEADAPPVSAEPPDLYWSTRASRRWA